MSTSFSNLSKVVLLGLAYTAWAAALNAQAQPPTPAHGVMPYQLFSANERAAFCAQMRDAATPAERQLLARRMHGTMIKRAGEQGIGLPPGMRNGNPAMGHGAAGTGMYGMGCGPGSGFADGRSVESTGDMPVRYDHGIAFVTGGVGEDEAAALRAVASRYSMVATFASNSGEYLSGVAVQVLKPDGAHVFNAVSEGPYLFARLPPGRYRLVATSDGLKRTRTIVVPAKGGVRVTLNWPIARPGPSQ